MPILRHIVLLKFKDDVDKAAAAAEITAGLEAILEAEEREERRAQEAIFDLNIKYNKVVPECWCLYSHYKLFSGH